MTTASPAGGSGWINTNQVTLKASSNPYSIGIHYIRYYVDGRATQTANWASTTIALVDGTHYIVYWSTDNAGNVETRNNVSYNVDATPPVTTATLSGSLCEDGWYMYYIQATLSATDATSGVAATYYTLDGGAQQTYSSSNPIMIGEGMHTLKYWSVDHAGNTEAQNTQSINVDFTSPVTTASPAGGSGWINTNKVTLSAKDVTSGVKSISYYVDRGDIQVVVHPSFDNWNQSYYTTINLNDGPHTITYWSADNAYNTETLNDGNYNVHYNVDTTPPVTSATPSGTMGKNSWYTSNVQVTLGATDTWSGIAATYYTLDGGAQRAYSSSNPITVGEGTHTMKYWSVDHAGNTEAQKSLTLNVDTTAPSITPSYPLANANGWFNGNVPVHYICSDGLSGIDPLTLPSDYTFTAEGAGQSTTASVSDLAGNSASVTVNSINIDKTPPAISGKASSPPNVNNWYNGGVTVNFTASDPLSGINTITGNTTLTGEGAGQSVTGTATDHAGNVASATVNGINIDESAPVVTLAITPGTAPSGWYVSDAVVNITATDAISGVDSIGYDLDGSGWMPYSSNLTLSDGKHTLQYRAVDKAGNVAGVYTKTINVDTSAPISTVNLAGTAGTNGWYTSNITVTINPAVGASGFDHSEYSFDGVNWVRGSSYAIVTEGVNTSYYRSVDGAGNVEAFKTLVVKVDRSLPSISCALSGNKNPKGWYSSDVGVTLSAADAISGVNRMEYSTNGLLWNKYTGTFTIPLGSQLTVHYRAIDNASNSAGGSTFVYFPPQSFNVFGTMAGLLSLGQPTATPTATPTITPSTPQTTTGPSSPSATPVPAGTPTATTTPSDSPQQGGSGTTIYLIGFGVIVVAAAGAYFLFTRK